MHIAEFFVNDGISGFCISVDCGGCVLLDFDEPWMGLDFVVSSPFLGLFPFCLLIIIAKC